jgi:hypothetical protein
MWTNSKIMDKSENYGQKPLSDLGGRKINCKTKHPATTPPIVVQS